MDEQQSYWKDQLVKIFNLPSTEDKAEALKEVPDLYLRHFKDEFRKSGKIYGDLIDHEIERRGDQVVESRFKKQLYLAYVAAAVSVIGAIVSIVVAAKGWGAPQG